ncbi:Gfo/Idh/MocA family protein [Pelagibacterium luteolum]|uniref:Predicted dehydrogenase n=1 Tax=Pelagibacterium luteolum TaxID=440168 RepID=A0A1G7VF70_9HYPH|nr:Gfo/Idh/MocA family oxidoreductase [Pelagibacterium luteolum]SDG58466.1 Predicted dehydrogenase [Pelagibacterium luteolum]
MRRLKLCLLGAGGIANRHAQAAAEMAERFTISGVCAPTLPGAEALATLHGAEAFTNCDEMLDTLRPDLMVIAIPPFAHAGELERAARRGVHLLVEKPIALNFKRAEAMVSAVEESGVVAACGFMYRFGAAVERWQALRADDATGAPGHFSGHFHCNALHAPWWRSREKSGGQMVEQLIHIVDLCRLMLGEPDTVYARAANLFHRGVEGYDIEDVSAMVLGYDDGRVGVLGASNSAVPGQWRKSWQIVAQDMTGVFTDFNAAEFFSVANPQSPERIAVTQDVFVAQLRDVADAIFNSTPPRVPLREGLLSLRVVLAAARSAHTGGEVRL